MSITSNELNYLVWRYLEESGHELAAYALEKLSGCANAPEMKKLALEVPPGYLVEMVQKGILYGLVDKESRKDADYSLWGTLAEKELARLNGTVELKVKSTHDDVEMNGSTADEAKDAQETASQPQKKEELPVVTLSPKVSFSESVSCLWHPLTEVLAYGQRDLTAVISAFNGDEIAESVELCHPIMLDSKPDINIVSWSPQGTVIVTAATNGELRAWLPDGKLKNIATVPSGESRVFCTLVWNTSGQYLISIDMNNEVCLWDGNLSLLQQVQPGAPSALGASSIEACWLDDTKFALTSPRRSIKIYSVAPTGSSTIIKPIGSLAGHDNGATVLSFDPESRLLASASDYDYLIKIWHSNSSHDALTLNAQDNAGLYRHSSPVVCLSWISPSVLLSALMEGVVNVWDTKSGNFNSSTRIFEGFEGRLLFNAQVSPDKKFVATGDNYGHIKVWSIDADGLVERAIYESTNKLAVCDLQWNLTSHKLCVSYNNGPSVVLDWKN